MKKLSEIFKLNLNEGFGLRGLNQQNVDEINNLSTKQKWASVLATALSNTDTDFEVGHQDLGDLMLDDDSIQDLLEQIEDNVEANKGAFPMASNDLKNKMMMFLDQYRDRFGKNALPVSVNAYIQRYWTK